MARQLRRQQRFLCWEWACGFCAKKVTQSTRSMIALLVAYVGSLGSKYAVASGRTTALATWLLGYIVVLMGLKQARLPLLKRGLPTNPFSAGWLFWMVDLVLSMTMVSIVKTGLDTVSTTAIQGVIVVGCAPLGGGWLASRKRWLHRAPGMG